MIIAKEKKKNNIAEYILYIWQVEDLIRANQCNFEKIDSNFISKFDVSPDIYEEIKNWYKGLINMMVAEQITTSGHLQFIKNTLNDLNELHLYLIKSQNDSKYLELYQKAEPIISEYNLRIKTPSTCETEICLNALYASLMLKLKGIPLSEETTVGIQIFSRLLGYLSDKYKRFVNGEISLDDL